MASSKCAISPAAHSWATYIAVVRIHDENPTGTGQSFASNRLFKIYVMRAPTACIAVPRVIESSGIKR